MKNNLVILITTELKRSWTRTKIIVSSILCLVLCLLSALPGIFGFLENIPIPVMQVTDYLVNVWKMMMPFAVFFFTVGIIASDIKNHWLRTLLIHSITRQQIVLSKMLSALISVIIILLVLGLLPILVFIFTSGIEYEFSFLSTLGIVGVYMLETLLYIAMATWLSCIIPGFFNVFILAGWMFLDSTIIKGILMLFFSDYKYFSIFADFFFPSGFSEAITILSGKGDFPWDPLLWGATGLTLFLTLAFWQINKIKIDTNTD
jgi:ABC-type transport system involved in multi-copper enzyme maturation permease subunit